MDEVVSKVYAEVKKDNPRSWYNKFPIIRNFYEDEYVRRQVLDPRRQAINELSKKVDHALCEMGKHPPGVVDIRQFSESLEKNVKDKLVSLDTEVKGFHKHSHAQAENKSEHGRISGELTKAKNNILALDQQKKELTEMKDQTGNEVKIDSAPPKTHNG